MNSVVWLGWEGGGGGREGGREGEGGWGIIIDSKYPE